jgi:hypothetical protein
MSVVMSPPIGGESSREANAGSEDAIFEWEMAVTDQVLSAVQGGVEQVNAEEGDEEPVEEGDGVHRVCCVEALEEDEGSYDRCCCECDVVDWIHSEGRELVYQGG